LSFASAPAAPLLCAVSNVFVISACESFTTVRSNFEPASVVEEGKEFAIVNDNFHTFVVDHGPKALVALVVGSNVGKFQRDGN